MTSLPPTPPNSPIPPPPSTPTSPTGSSYPNRPNFERRATKPTMHPRRVVGGIRMQGRPGTTTETTSAFLASAVPATNTAEDAQTAETAEAPAVQVETAPLAAAPSTAWSWASARWMRLAEDHAPGDQISEGLDYARLGQTRSLDFGAGTIGARVQGRMPQAYKMAIRLPTFTPEQWETVTSAMSTQAKYAATLLSGELPPNIEDLFAPAGLRLFPTEASDLSCSCDCDVFAGRIRDPQTGTVLVQAAPPSGKAAANLGTRWCKHICCVMYLIAEKLAQQPLFIFTLRGLPEADLLERLRQQRALAGLQRTGNGAAPIYTPHVPGLLRLDAPITDSLVIPGGFWMAAELDALDGLDMPIAPPEVSHPLLRRVGASPFAGAKFPMVGLLATCYEVISASVIRENETGTQTDPDSGIQPAL